MTLPDRDEAAGWGGLTVVDRDGATIGACTQVWTDDATGRPEWATARMGSLSVLLPLVGAVQEGDRVRVTVGRDEALLAPHPAGGRHLDPDEEARLYRHFGIPFSREASDSLLPTGSDVHGLGTGETAPGLLPARDRTTRERGLLERRWPWWVAAGVATCLAVLAAASDRRR